MEDASVGPGDAGSSGAVGSNCSPIGGATCLPAQGLTCCVDTTDVESLISDPSSLGTCEVAAACMSMVQYECTGTAGCATGQVCCGGVGGDSGALFGADAAALAANGGSAAGIGSLLGGFSSIMLESFCQTSCLATQTQLCSTTADCPEGSICGAPTAATAGLAGAAALTGLFGTLGGSAGFSLLVCQPADAGTTMTEAGTVLAEGGASDAGADVAFGEGGTSDAQTSTAEGGATIEAGGSADASSD
jgi:hypothetical protein